MKYCENCFYLRGDDGKCMHESATIKKSMEYMDFVTNGTETTAQKYAQNNRRNGAFLSWLFGYCGVNAKFYKDKMEG